MRIGNHPRKCLILDLSHGPEALRNFFYPDPDKTAYPFEQTKEKPRVEVVQGNSYTESKHETIKGRLKQLKKKI
jgi:hypothetical protein